MNVATRTRTTLKRASSALLGSYSTGLVFAAAFGLSVASGVTAASPGPGVLPKPLSALTPPEPVTLLPGYADFFTQQLANDNVPGGVYAIVHRDRIVEMHTFGVRSRGNPEPVTPDTVFRIASVSKTFAGNMASMLENRGYFTLSDSVKQYVPTLDFKNTDYSLQLQVEHILAHSSGVIPNAYDNLIEANLERQQIIPHFNRINPMCTPGRCYGYQNVLFSFIEDVVEETTGQSYADWVATHIFTPLAMSTASMGYEGFVNTEDKALPHIRGRNGWITRQVGPHYYRFSSAAGVNASAKDLSQWLIAQMGYNADIMPPEVLAQVREKRIHTSRDLRRRAWQPYLNNAHYGLGWRIYEFMNHDIVYHGGWVQGFRAEIAYSPDFDIGIVILMNAESSAMNSLSPEFWRQVIPLMQEEQYVPYAFANGVRTSYITRGVKRRSFMTDQLPEPAPNLLQDFLGR
ncbi:beta-lactamase family protein [Aliidiomarina halalkaliphila]|uniref:Beta-lactamase family protein n=1 Tax=Aliidiomarina halalkaliphila TaxID=2593535 RepID=A0A552WZ08_9GAMM|nr:serine hydrolase domain-containing protein [Aliidiomarina halalkaliphila]TRW48058.1 beta-lactamase family protein [Aliidiomarina halalkaliphila]